MRTFRELIQNRSFEDRFNYLKLNGIVGEDTFAHSRYLNQQFYKSYQWQQARNQVILRDDGCDLAHPDYQIQGRIYIHHIEPITIDDILNNSTKLTDLNNLICVSFDTHQAIHYGDYNLINKNLIVREKGDTKLW